MRVAVRMVLNQVSIVSLYVWFRTSVETYSGDDSLCFVAAVLAYKPTGRFDNPPETKDLDEAGQCLEDRRDSPRPGVHDSESSVSRPSSYNSTETPQRVVYADHGCFLCREC
jgi:hypothetical protein